MNPFGEICLVCIVFISPVPVYLDDLVVDVDAAVAFGRAAGRDGLDKDAQLFQPGVRPHAHPNDGQAQTESRTVSY